MERRWLPHGDIVLFGVLFDSRLGQFVASAALSVWFRDNCNDLEPYIDQCRKRIEAKFFATEEDDGETSLPRVSDYL